MQANPEWTSATYTSLPPPPAYEVVTPRQTTQPTCQIPGPNLGEGLYTLTVGGGVALAPGGLLHRSPERPKPRIRLGQPSHLHRPASRQPAAKHSYPHTRPKAAPASTTPQAARAISSVSSARDPAGSYPASSGSTRWKDQQDDGPND